MGIVRLAAIRAALYAQAITRLKEIGRPASDVPSGCVLDLTAITLRYGGRMARPPERHEPVRTVQTVAQETAGALLRERVVAPQTQRVATNSQVRPISSICAQRVP